MQRWKLSALAAATLAFSGFTSSDAWALALGRITVQSALGEPLRAEVEIPQLTAAEAESLQAAVASPEAFRAQGMEYSGAANTVRVKVIKRANGSTTLQLSSFQPVNDPFIDLVIDANWASGKLQRNYTLLLDPPSARRAAPAVTAAAQASAPESIATRPSRPAMVERAPAAPMASAPVTRDAQDEAKPAPRKRAAPANNTVAVAAGGGVTVKKGDTAGRIAAAHRPAGVSLDQMLVAMLRTNPQAFINGNVNRVRTGSVINLPDDAAVKSTSQSEARQIMAAQSHDFNQFRRQLAGAAPVAPVEAASRTVTGQVQAHVEESKASTAAPDKLTLSKGAVKGVAADDRLAQQKQNENQTARADELKRNMAELSQIAAASKPEGAATNAPASAAATVPAATAPGLNVAGTTAAANTGVTPGVVPGTEAAPAAPVQPAAEPVAPTTPSADANANAAAPAETEPAKPAEVAVTPAPAVTAQAAPAPAAPAEPSFIDGLMEDPTIPLAGAAILALLLGYGGYRVSQRRKAAAAADNAFGDSQLAADSFFGASGGQRVDTGTSSQMSGHSMQYSPSQLDAGDVDPLAEADVYLAYGRDLQAEEILKEALRSDPNRLVLHQKLAEIYAKRHDRRAYESVANTVYGLTQGQGPEWQRLAEQGRTLDPENSLYQPGGSPQAKPVLDSYSAASAQFSPTEPSTAITGNTLMAGAAGAAGTLGFGAALASVNQTLQRTDDREGPPTVPVGMDMDMDLPGGLADASLPTPHLEMDSPAPPSEQDFAELEQRSHIDAALQPAFHTPSPVQAPSASLAEPDFLADNGLNMDLSDLDMFNAPTQPAALTETTAPAHAETNASNALNALEFDLDSFILPQTTAAASSVTHSESAEIAHGLDAPALNMHEDPGTEAMTLQMPISYSADVYTSHTNTTASDKAEAAVPMYPVNFDLGGLSLDLGSPAAHHAETTAAPTAPEDPLATKLALAEEFNAIGDSDGARTLIEEVIAEAHGDLKNRAQELLSQIG